MCIRDRFTVGQQTVLVRNDDYKSASALSKNQGPTKFKKLTFREIGEESTAYLELKTGGADVLVNVPTDFLPRIQADKAVKLVTIPGNEVVYMPINTSVEPFTDVKVREATAFAVNQKEILTSLYGGNGATADTFLISLLKESQDVYKRQGFAQRADGRALLPDARLQEPEGPQGLSLIHI